MFFVYLLLFVLASTSAKSENPNLRYIELKSLAHKVDLHWGVSGPTDSIANFQIIRLNTESNNELGYIVPKNVRQLLFEDLETDTNYEVCVYIFLSSSTHKYGNCSEITTAASDPVVGDLKLEMEENRVKASWKLNFGRDEDVSQYHVTWDPPHNGGIGVRFGDDMIYYIKNLNAETLYKVCVTPTSYFWNVVLESTCDTIVPVADISIVNIEFVTRSTATHVSWSVNGINKIPQQSFVIWKTLNSNNDTGSYITSVISYIVRDLKPRSSYTICIQGRDENINDFVTLKHCEDIVTPPTEVEVTSLELIPNVDTILVNWEILHHDTSVQYNSFLLAWESDGISDSIYTENNQVLISNLDSATDYTVCAQAVIDNNILLEQTCSTTTTLTEYRQL